MTESLAAAEVPVLTGFEPFTAEFRADPYPEYRRIAAMGGPVYWEYYESYIVSSYADARTVLA
ncbi:MAG: cytochrome P450, partial [Actinomadura rubrobrunea]|nr:cytochrome P450 [Actinomadura rubrobrunea]